MLCGVADDYVADMNPTFLFLSDFEF